MNSVAPRIGPEQSREGVCWTHERIAFSVVKMYNGLGGHGGWADEVLRSDAARVRGFLSGPGPWPCSWNGASIGRLNGGKRFGNLCSRCSPQPKTPDSLRREASQAAGAAPTLRYGPAGDSAPRLRLKAFLVLTERFLSARPHGPTPPRSRSACASTPAAAAQKCPAFQEPLGALLVYF